MLDLIIDGSYILNKNVFYLHREQTIYSKLYDSMKDSVRKYVRYYNFNKIYIVADSKKPSWRKSIYKEYKQNRIRNNEIDWNYVFQTYESVLEELSNKYKILKYDSIEGDDFISFIIRKNNNKGISNFIISSDQDLFQFLTYNKTQETINFMSNDYRAEKIFLPNNYKTYLSDQGEKPDSSKDLFNYSDNIPISSFIKNYTKYKDVREIDNIKSLFEKIIKGDKSDNIKSVYVNESTKRGIGDAGAEKVYEMYTNEFGIPNMNNLNELFENVADIVTEYKKAPSKDFNGIINNVKTNYELVCLSYLPDWVEKQIEEIY